LPRILEAHRKVSIADRLPVLENGFRRALHCPAELMASQRTFAIGIWITSFSAGAAIGPLVGSELLERFWWGSVFLVGVPVMVLLLVVGPKLLPEFRDPRAGR
jgi:MFS family permease